MYGTSAYRTIENDSAILTPKNCDCDVINSIAIRNFSEESTILHLYSADTVKNNDGTNNLSNNLYPTEFLNSINVNGLPLHKLELKVRALVMLLRNIDVNSGLCNGTAMKVISITTKILKVQITNGSHVGDYALIPRIELSPSDSLLPFKLSRRRFPIKLCFAMTINKAQGQITNNLGVYLPQPVFLHGQLYVALSRAGIPQDKSYDNQYKRHTKILRKL